MNDGDEFFNKKASESFVESMHRESNLEPIVIDFIELIAKSNETSSVFKTVRAFFSLSRDKQELILSGIIGLMAGIMNVIDAGLMDAKGNLNYELDKQKDLNYEDYELNRYKEDSLNHNIHNEDDLNESNSDA